MGYSVGSAAGEAAAALGQPFGPPTELPAELAEAASAGGFSVSKLREGFGELVERTLSTYVSLRSAGLSALLATAFDPADGVWAAGEPPAGIRPAVDPVVEMIAGMDAETRPMVAGQLPTQRNKDFSNAVIVKSLSEVTVEGLAARMMKQKVELLGQSGVVSRHVLSTHSILTFFRPPNPLPPICDRRSLPEPRLGHPQGRLDSRAWWRRACAKRCGRWASSTGWLLSRRPGPSSASLT